MEFASYEDYLAYQAQQDAELLEKLKELILADVLEEAL